MSFDIAKYPTLALVDTTQELRLLPKESLPKLCDELRRYLLDSVSRSSGHFASGLGTVELTVALHYVYNTPFDQLIWDVGHQAYPHKILTGRRDKIGTIRQKNGLHPFPWRGESEYDVLSVGHSSTLNQRRDRCCRRGREGGQTAAHRLRDWRRRDHRRDGVRSHEPRRGYSPRYAGGAQRQRNVDFRKRRCAE